MSSLTFLQACRQRTLHGPIVVRSLGCLMVVFTPAPTWSFAGGCAILIQAWTDPACLFAVFLSCPFSGLRESLVAPISSGSLLELIVRNVPPPHYVSQASRSSNHGVAEKQSQSHLWLLSVRWEPVIWSILRDASAWSLRCYLYLDSPYTPPRWFHHRNVKSKVVFSLVSFDLIEFRLWMIVSIRKICTHIIAFWPDWKKKKKKIWSYQMISVSKASQNFSVS